MPSFRAAHAAGNGLQADRTFLHRHHYTSPGNTASTSQGTSGACGPTGPSGRDEPQQRAAGPSTALFAGTLHGEHEADG